MFCHLRRLWNACRRDPDANPSPTQADHLNNCPECREHEARLREVDALLRKPAAPVQAPPFLADRILNAVERSKTAPAPRHAPIIHIGPRLAAGLAACLMVAFSVVLLNPTSTPDQIVTPVDPDPSRVEITPDESERHVIAFAEELLFGSEDAEETSTDWEGMLISAMTSEMQGLQADSLNAGNFVSECVQLRTEEDSVE